MIKKMLVLLLLAGVVAYSQGPNVYRTDIPDRIQVVNVASGDDSTSLSGRNRGIKVDEEGIVKLQITPTGGNAYTTVEYFAAGLLYPIGHVTRVYQYYDSAGTAAATCKVYDSTGTSVVGIKILR